MALLLAGAVAVPLSAQDTAAVVGIRVEPDTVTVGDRFRAAVFVRAPAGSRVELVVPPAAVDGTWRTIDSIRSYPPDSAGVHRAVATMVLWVTDPATSAGAEARVTLPDGAARTIPIPRRSWTWTWIAAAVAAALALLAWWMIRRRRGPPVLAPIDPREHALAELDRLRASGAPADVEAFSAGVSGILREFAAQVDPRLGTDLTTAELLDHLRRTGAREEDVESVARALTHADLAKFARRRPAPEGALADWEAARRWVQTFRRAEVENAPELVEAGAAR